LRANSTFSSDIAHAVSLGGVLLFVQSGYSDSPAASRALRVADDKIPGRCAETFVHIQVEALAADSPRK
jgi:hypothetical protein